MIFGSHKVESNLMTDTSILYRAVVKKLNLMVFKLNKIYTIIHDINNDSLNKFQLKVIIII